MSVTSEIWNYGQCVKASPMNVCLTERSVSVDIKSGEECWNQARNGEMRAENAGILKGLWAADDLSLTNPRLNILKIKICHFPDLEIFLLKVHRCIYAYPMVSKGCMDVALKCSTQNNSKNANA